MTYEAGLRPVASDREGTQRRAHRVANAYDPAVGLNHLPNQFLGARTRTPIPPRQMAGRVAQPRRATADDITSAWLQRGLSETAGARSRAFRLGGECSTGGQGGSGRGTAGPAFIPR